ncbi:MAG: DUF805 domain-containing protein [Bacteroidetes bacterium]|nr:DUF805 domain-containing protein [Bacteroidota bacterium]
MLEFLFYFKKCLLNYANFEGRARRKECWMFYFVNIIICAILAAFLILINQNENQYSWAIDIISTLLFFIMTIYGLAIIIPTIAVSVRRLHDIGKSGWFYLLFLVPIVGSIIMLVFLCSSGDIGDNKYGPDPKETPIVE